MKRKRCRICIPEEQCDDCFISRVDSEVNLNDTIAAIEKVLSPENREKFKAMPLRKKQWLAVDAWCSDLVKYTGKVVPR